jgi:hypothetical protein
MTTAVAAQSVHLVAYLQRRGSGTMISLDVSGLPRHVKCELMLMDRDGRTERAATWWSGTGRASGVTASTSEPLSQVRALQVRAENKEVITDWVARPDRRR